MRFVDTNVLLYAVGGLAEDAAKVERAREILAGRDLAFSVQVMQEFYVQATRQSRPDPLTHSEALVYLSNWRRFPICAITLEILDEALAIRLRFGLSYWDSAIVAAARWQNCTEIVSEDMSDGQDYGGVTVRNPFK